MQGTSAYKVLILILLVSFSSCSSSRRQTVSFHVLRQVTDSLHYDAANRLRQASYDWNFKIGFDSLHFDWVIGPDSVSIVPSDIVRVSRSSSADVSAVSSIYTAEGNAFYDVSYVEDSISFSCVEPAATDEPQVSALQRRGRLLKGSLFLFVAGFLFSFWFSSRFSSIVSFIKRLFHV